MILKFFLRILKRLNSKNRFIHDLIRSAILLLGLLIAIFPPIQRTFKKHLKQFIKPKNTVRIRLILQINLNMISFSEYSNV
jgi:hypothetical protein